MYAKNAKIAIFKCFLSAIFRVYSAHCSKVVHMHVQRILQISFTFLGTRLCIRISVGAFANISNQSSRGCIKNSIKIVTATLKGITALLNAVLQQRWCNSFYKLSVFLKKMSKLSQLSIMAEHTLKKLSTFKHLSTLKNSRMSWKSRK